MVHSDTVPDAGQIYPRYRRKNHITSDSTALTIRQVVNGK
jgi:hypothetical protein